MQIRAAGKRKQEASFKNTKPVSSIVSLIREAKILRKRNAEQRFDTSNFFRQDSRWECALPSFIVGMQPDLDPLPGRNHKRFGVTHQTCTFTASDMDG